MTVPVIAEPVVRIGAFTVTNALVNSSLLMLAIVSFSFWFRSSLHKIPGRIQNLIELLLETMLGYFDQVTKSRAKSKRFLPLVGSLFIFILLSNWMGLLPGTGSIGVWQVVHGELELVPILRPAMSDLNLTLAMALLSIITSHVLGMLTVGFFVHWNRFIQLGGLWKGVKTLNPMKILVAMIEFLVGLLEIVSELAKVLSLSLRLFGNIFAGEVLMTVIAGLVSFIVPMPFMLLEILVGIVQATVFSMLTLVYLSVLTEKPHGSHEEHPVAVASHA
ncbi:ATP synthase F0 subunit A [Candidatus Uhrbacteria bacterium RIFCSPHIGHO2_12_FULL_60_25]|uniref:ATP synthase subunit a n=1 Tax=Candidatus Uhrbacteria bacterium RIFCSPHIGHO2_12_FULL_60_25 TaxID=1802399 RepID=A0A1F7UK62_9BACT|nr:MAG: ATP synthase F0 subunit A [Candidatus Uhrbacteria bacterium RIFCSPHIGHO2_02_FULL_60_44]OGL78097.1 MAG: ATP synthase F0 subunit A [Candidatus Uhrbacteria bacterium RIFCSPHIGHO2_12_FULL_60_25]